MSGWAKTTADGDGTGWRATQARPGRAGKASVGDSIHCRFVAERNKRLIESRLRDTGRAGLSEGGGIMGLAA